MHLARSASVHPNKGENNHRWKFFVVFGFGFLADKIHVAAHSSEKGGKI
jgi:hypothetical protein